ncbi:MULTISPECIES: helix-turn-helix domain-containing protein [unclassified Paenibacillus]|uniref:Helix-turn-helix domain-containing protein n=1 Tax=Paenibacillus provencensis TaxID=441151 RepID=A0ABW3PX42_9BACL|nr:MULTISPECIES: helix-turn-helix domain-containing protein [unclassified Paenibacillus]MCM3129496.1 helix-turn-helix domain-containing protein [Paenibacillus sp. MER 78]SFS73998.1 Helix-turn-helix domain-containing protein [Paenibacillus sp. 453mf]
MNNLEHVVSRARESGSKRSAPVIRLRVFREEKDSVKQSAIVTSMLELVHNHYADADLSLNTVARHMLYMNPDYLGKMFKKDTGLNFSQYLNQYRIRQACSYIQQEDEDVKIFELAEWFGFGGNSGYFSQVFKRWTGMTPSHYKRRAR